MTDDSALDTVVLRSVVVALLLMLRSGVTVVELLPALAQSLPGLGSVSSGGKAVVPATAPAGTELPVQALLIRLPATPALVVSNRSGKAAPTAKPPGLVLSQTTVLPLTLQLQLPPLKPT